MSETVLIINNLVKTFEQGGNRLDVLRGCNARIEAGELVALVGPSGAGKSTLLHCVGLLEQPTSGDVILGGKNACRARDDERTALRREYVGFVYQFHHLLPEFSARENIMLPQIVAGQGDRKAGARADELLGLVGLTPRASHRPARLSGGEQQRVAIARAMANDPRLLVADEPTGNLDHNTADHVFDLLRGLVKERGLGLLMATHNLELAAKMDRVLELKDGHITN
ncbi:MAG: ATP-binding cassette domain-containing protein [Alphaproteobacteria bacterium]|nr:ATP-binding cassette domain-containing protein [Alphaproteobacteria bacterium]